MSLQPRSALEAANGKLIRHVVFCPRANEKIVNFGDSAEYRATKYLVDNLQSRSVGDFRVLTNYHLPFNTSGASGTLEIDIVVVCRSGIVLLEVKDWNGTIDAYNDKWIKDSRFSSGNPQISVENKAKMLRSHWFSGAGALNDLGAVNVRSLVVLARGRNQFRNHSNLDDSNIVGIDAALLLALNPPVISQRPGQRMLTDTEIARVAETLYKRHTTGDLLIEDYRVVKKILPGDLYKAYEAFKQSLPRMRVRIKVYQVSDLANISSNELERVRRNAEAVSTMGIHPNIVHTLNFFPDPDRPDLFYEVTELVEGLRLDKYLMDRAQPIPFDWQVGCIEQLGSALAHAHRNDVIHRNISPESVYVAKSGVIKLADFDFAKVKDMNTLMVGSTRLSDTPFLAPELSIDPSNASPASDLYSLGYLWLHLAMWPSSKAVLRSADIDDASTLPEQARRLLHALLSRAPDSRPQSAEKLLRRLDQWTK